MFLSKKAWHKFKGYAFSQLNKMKSKQVKLFVHMCQANGLDPLNITIEDALVFFQSKRIDKSHDQVLTKLFNDVGVPSKRTKRIPRIIEHGYDTKFGYHVVRLIDECQQILEEGDLDLTRSREHLKAIRRGEWSEEKVVNYFDTKLAVLEDVYGKSDLRYSPDEEAIKTLLVECLEMHYGSIDKMVDMNNVAKQYLLDAHAILDKAVKLINQEIMSNYLLITILSLFFIMCVGGFLGFKEDGTVCFFITLAYCCMGAGWFVGMGMNMIVDFVKQVWAIYC